MERNLKKSATHKTLRVFFKKSQNIPKNMLLSLIFQHLDQIKVLLQSYLVSEFTPEP